MAKELKELNSVPWEWNIDMDYRRLEDYFSFSVHNKSYQIRSWIKEKLQYLCSYGTIRRKLERRESEGWQKNLQGIERYSESAMVVLSKIPYGDQVI